MALYHPSTSRSIADIGSGIRVQTGTMGYLTYLDHSPATTNAVFNVYGAIMVTQLYAEVTATVSSDACQPQFNYTATTPVVGVNPMCAVSASLADAAVGLRVVWCGGAVATAAVITDSAGVSDVTCLTPQIVGGVGFVGSIGWLCTAATATAGSLVAFLHYYPYTDGAYAVAAV
jgi:hypothetical protein